MNASEKSVIYIGGIDDSITEDVLIAAFIPFGEIKNIDVPLDHTTGTFL
jgi:peptidyl-prolyl isomerase E (cyclophilin E)